MESENVSSHKVGLLQLQVGPVVSSGLAMEGTASKKKIRKIIQRDYEERLDYRHGGMVAKGRAC